MKKVLCTIALMLLVATSAYAQATFSLTGSYWAEGKYWFNYNPTPRTDTGADLYNDSSFGFYEQDVNLFPKITVGNTSLNMKIAITDTNWGEVAAGDTTNDLGTNYLEPDDNIAIERAFITHKFGDKFTLDVGLMDGTQWGTVFADDKTGRWRVKGTAVTPIGVVGGLVEKIAEIGADGQNAAAENDDSDNYALFAVTKVGSVYIKPLFFYVDTDHVIPGDGDNYFKRLYYSLAFDGELGPVSFESEFNYNDYKLEAGDGAIDEDWNTWGMYFNVWKALDSMTPGFVFAYGSYDGDQAANFAALGQFVDPSFNNFAYFSGLDFEDDFNSTVILGDEFGWGGGDDLLAATLLKLYVNEIKTGIEPLTLSTYFAYVMSNQEDGQESISGLNTTVPNTYEDATAWEFGLGATYRITDNLYYMPYFAYADINYDVTGIDDPDAVYIIANGIEFTF